jgi:hypothetical protein
MKTELVTRGMAGMLLIGAALAFTGCGAGDGGAEGKHGASERPIALAGLNASANGVPRRTLVRHVSSGCDDRPSDGRRKRDFAPDCENAS